MSMIVPRPIVPKAHPIRDESARRAWAAQHDYCFACGASLDYLQAIGSWLETHHLARGVGRSDEPCNLFRSCMRDHKLCHGEQVVAYGVRLPLLTLGMQLTIKQLATPDEWNPERLAVLYGQCLPSLAPVPEWFQMEFLRNRGNRYCKA